MGHHVVELTNKFAVLPSIQLFIQLISQSVNYINQTLSLSVYQPSLQLACVLIIKQSIHQSISHSYSLASQLINEAVCSSSAYQQGSDSLEKSLNFRGSP